MKAVHAVEDDSTRVTLAKLTVPDLNRMFNLANYWDTLGWVYYQENQFEKAQKYLEASWNLNQVAAVGEHLAHVYEKQGKKAQAAHQMELARHLGKSGFQMNYRYSPNAVSPGEELSEMRRKNLGKLGAPSASAEFFALLVQGGKVEDVKFVSGSDSMRSLAKTLSALKFKAPLPDDAPVKLVRRGEIGRAHV